MVVDAEGTDRLIENADAPAGAEEQVRLSDENREKLATKLGPLLDVVNADSNESPADPEGTEDEVEGTDEEIEEGKDDTEVTDDGTDDDDGKPEAVDANAEPTLPAAYRRSMKARQWTDHEIDDFMALDSDKAMQTAERIHTSRIAEMAGFAQAGRNLRTNQGSTPAAAASAPTATEAAAAAAMSIDVEALGAEMGNMDVANAIAGPINKAIQVLQDYIPRLDAGLGQLDRSTQNTLSQQVEAFFASDDLKPYALMYGNLKDGRSEKQSENWVGVLDLADQIRAGALAQGQDMDVEEALENAHASVSAKFQAEVIRKDIKKKTQKRATSVTLKPRSRRQSKSSGRPANPSAFEKKVGAKLAAAMGLGD